MTNVEKIFHLDPRSKELAVKENLGKRLSGIRISLGWSQGYLADRLGVNQATVSRWEHGKWKDMPPMAVLAVFAIFQGCSVQKLTEPIDYEGDEFKPRKFIPNEINGIQHFLTQLDMLSPDPKAGKFENDLQFTIASALLYMIRDQRRDWSGRWHFDFKKRRLQRLVKSEYDYHPISSLPKNCIVACP